MALINTSLPNLIQGVSQQPDATRFSGQCDEQINFMSSVVDGLTKRNGTRYIDELLASDIGADSFVHFINRSEEERYVLINNGNYLYAFNVLTGDIAKINGVAAGYSVAGTYLDVDSPSTPREALRAITVADGTFLVNRTVPVGIEDSSRSPSLDKEALIFVKQGDYGKEYAFDIKTDSTSPQQATVDLEYKPVTDGKGGWRYLLVGVSLAPSGGGAGYTAGGKYKINNLPATYTFTVGGTSYDLEPIWGEGGTDATIEVTSESSGVVTGVDVANVGRYLDFKPGGVHPSKYNTTTFDIRVNLETPPAKQGVDSYDTITSIRVYSEPGTDHSYHADTTRITEVIADFDKDASGYGIDYHNISTGELPAPSTWNSISDAFSGINATTGNAEFSMVRDGNLIVLTRRDGESDFTITPKDGLGGNALGIVYKEVGAITDLPVYAKNGFTVKVRGDAESNADDYYVRFETDGGQEIGKGKWVETIGPDLLLNYETASVADTTLPLIITNTNPDEFEIKPMSVAPRSVGDDESNPFPSFTGRRIQNCVFFKNRLGFVCDNNIILSEAGLGSYNDSGVFEYNFSRTTVTTLLDSDPIDVTIESNRVTNLTAATAVQENLILFADNGQFVLKGEELLTPRTVSVKPVTNFEYNEDTDPVSVGSFIYYPFDFGNHTGIREFSLNKDTDVYESNAITEQIPRYIPKDITRLAGSLSENLLAALCSDDANTLYVYRYFYSEGRKVLSSWFKWTFASEVRGFEFMDSTLYLLLSNPNNDTTYLAHLPLNFDGLDEGIVDYTFTSLPSDATVTSITDLETPFDEMHVTHLDDRMPAIAVSGSGGWQIRFPNYTADADRSLRENIANFNTYSAPTVFSSGSGAANFVVYNSRGVKLAVDTSSFPSVVITDDDDLVDGEPLWVGFEFDSKYVFSEQIFKAQSGQSRTPNAAAKLRIKNLSLYHTRTSDYELKVTPDMRQTYTNTYPATTKLWFDQTNTRVVPLVDVKQGFFRAPIFADSENLKISLENNGAMPSNFQSAEFETFIHTRSRRYGA